MRTLLETRVSELLHAVADATPTSPTPARSSDRLAEDEIELLPTAALTAPGSERRSPGRTGRVLVGAAAAALLAGGVAIVVTAADRVPSHVVTPGTAGTAVTDPNVVPKVRLPGWTTGSYSATPSTDDGGLRLTMVLRDPARGLGSPVVRVGSATAPNGYSVGPQPTQVAINAYAGSMATSGDVTSITWEPAPGRTTFVVGTGVASADVVAVARGLQADAAGVPVAAGTVPVPLAVTSLAPLPPTSTYAEYGFVNASRALQLSFYAGGAQMFELRAMDDQRSAVSVLGTTGLLLDYGGGRYRVDALLGPWTWEADGTGFASATAFLAAVNRVAVVDDSTWRASLPATTTPPAPTPPPAVTAVTGAVQATASTVATKVGG